MIHDVPFPPKNLRTSPWHTADNNFLETRRREVRQLIDDAGLTESTRVLDIGCGPGRLAIALLDRFGPPLRSQGGYLGVDIIKGVVDWCSKEINPRHPSMTFVHLDRHHRRYSGRGAKGVAPIVPAPDGEADLVYLFSVVSHMEGADLPGHLTEYERVMAPGGRLVLTGFILEGKIPDVEENPSMPGERWRGPLHCVRYRRDFFERQLFAAGLVVASEPIPKWDPTGQTRYVIVRKGEL